jgi:outer membrane protein assembly factor BamB/predicted MPP superfamily phosphohydrolase
MVFYKYIFTFCLLITFQVVFSQGFKFAQVTDTHIGNATGEEDLQRTVADINANPSIEFVIVSGDITEFGSDEELKLAKEILNKLNKPYHVVPGNHDTNWSESGGNSFIKTFGAGTYSFEHKGYVFAGTGSGPNMRMGPGQVPREDLVWLDSVLLTSANLRKPVIYINHYPQDSSLNNWYSALEILKKTNIQLMLCGHGHANKVYQFEGIPNIMGRSNLRAKDTTGGYNIITITKDLAIFEERKPLTSYLTQWLSVPLKDHQFHLETQPYPRPSFEINKKFSNVSILWEFQDDSDLGTGLSFYKNTAITANTNGEIYALDLRNGKQKWKFKTNGKIYSTPVVSGEFVVTGSSDSYIYCLKAKNGKLVWKYKTGKAVLGTAVIQSNLVYIGASDGVFRAINLQDGSLKWEFTKVKSFVVTKPLYYQDKIYFGSWGNEFYALNAKTGQQVWKWSNGATNRMFSPAACYPVAAHGKIFIVAPDRYMTALDAISGNQIWRHTIKDNRMRESMGISRDSSLVYAKTMDGKVFGVATLSSDFNITWKSSLQLPYELAPTAIVESNGLVFIPSHAGLVSALNRKNGEVVWQYKTSNTLVNAVLPVKKNNVMVSTMDGKITFLKFK